MFVELCVVSWGWFCGVGVRCVVVGVFGGVGVLWLVLWLVCLWEWNEIHVVLI